jgi:hypothetical protein
LKEFDWLMDEAAAHNERDWGKRLPGALTFLLAPWSEEVGTVSPVRAGWVAALIGLVRRLFVSILSFMFALYYWQDESQIFALLALLAIMLFCYF